MHRHGRLPPRCLRPPLRPARRKPFRSPWLLLRVPRDPTPTCSWTRPPRRSSIHRLPRNTSLRSRSSNHETSSRISVHGPLVDRHDRSDPGSFASAQRPAWPVNPERVRTDPYRATRHRRGSARFSYRLRAPDPRDSTPPARHPSDAGRVHRLGNAVAGPSHLLRNETGGGDGAGGLGHSQSRGHRVPWAAFLPKRRPGSVPVQCLQPGETEGGCSMRT